MDENVFSQALIAAMATTTLFALGSVIFEPFLFRLLNVPGVLAPMVAEYFGILRWALIIQVTTMVLYYFVPADGHPIPATVALVVGSLGNILLDLFFVYAGAAWCTAIAQVAQAALLCAYFFSRKRNLHSIWKQTRWSYFLRASYNGVSEFINEISVGIIIWILNFLLIARLGVNGVAAFSVVSYYIYLSLMLTYGVADALHLLVSQNYGAGKQARIRQFLSTAVINSGDIGLILSISLLLFHDQLPDTGSIPHQNRDKAFTSGSTLYTPPNSTVVSCYNTLQRSEVCMALGCLVRCRRTFPVKKQQPGT